MNPQSLRDFAARDWADVAAAKRAYWAERFNREGWLPIWTAAQGLLAYVRRIQPEFPTAPDRESDWVDHGVVRDKLNRAAHAFARR